ncbi:MAG: helix-turn-helix domain-containing protein [Acidobacteriota bacterium]
MKVKRGQEWVDMIAKRLEETRLALGKKHVDFARAAGISSQRWSNYARGRRPLDIEIAIALCDDKNLHLTLDWIYRGDPGGLRHDLAHKLAPRVDTSIIQLKKRR